MAFFAWHFLVRFLSILGSAFIPWVSACLISEGEFPERGGGMYMGILYSTLDNKCGFV